MDNNLIDGAINVRATMNRENVVKLIQSLSYSLLQDGDINIDIYMEDRITSWTTGDRIGSVTIGAHGGGNARATVIDSFISHRDEK